MPARFRAWWVRCRLWWAGVRVSLWFVPSAMTLAAAVLAWATVQIDAALLAGQPVDGYVAFGGGVEGARGVLGAIASSIITVTGVVFSVTVVVLQLASTQYTPRVLPTFTGDRRNQAVLGIFIGTFTYSLLVLRTVRSATEDGQPFVPSLSIGVALVLVVISIGALIYFINHAADSIRVSTIVDRVTRDSIRQVYDLFPAPIGRPARVGPQAPMPSEEPAGVLAEAAGYLQAIDAEELFRVAQAGRMTIRMEPRVGEFVLPGAVLASVWPPAAVGDDVAAMVRRAFVLGPAPTLRHDLGFGIRQIADIAVRALSPGVNDPTTALTCIDRLAEILVTLGNRELPETVRMDADGRVCFIARETRWEWAVALSFDQIRHYGVKDPCVARHLLETLGRVAALVPPDRHAPLARQVHAALGGVRKGIDERADLAPVERAAKGALGQIELIGTGATRRAA